MGRRRWRDYATAGGRRPVREFLQALDPEDVAAVAVAMKEVEEEGLQVTRHLQGSIYEVRAHGNRVIYRILFAPQGRRGQVLLATQRLQEEDSENALAVDPPCGAATTGLGGSRSTAPPSPRQKVNPLISN
jgi:hypothetical protein